MVSLKAFFFRKRVPIKPLNNAAFVIPNRGPCARLALSRPTSCGIHRGLLPKGLALWAVANPVTDANEAGVKRVRKKVDLGADVIITQPPLVWEPFER